MSFNDVTFNQVFSPPQTLGTFHRPSSYNGKIKDANLYSHKESSAYVYLALGAQANQMNCPASIESLVRKSGWDGPVYMITDREDCFDKEAIVKNAQMKKTSA